MITKMLIDVISTKDRIDVISKTKDRIDVNI